MSTHAPLPLEIDPATARTLRAENADTLFLDVREPFEREIVDLEPDRAVPYGEIPGAWNSLPRDKPVVVYCHHGSRSLRVAEFLRAHGVAGATSLAGGVERWAVELDPTLPRY